MKFSPSIKTILKSEIEETKGNCISINIVSSCCGKSLDIKSVKENDESKIKIFDDMPVVISNEDEKVLQEVIFDYEDGEVTIKKNCTCGNC